MSHLEFELKTADGLKLRGQEWVPETTPHSVVCLIHGLGDHSDRYHHMANVFNQAGYTLMAFDLRGHGRSEGKRGHTPGYSALMADIGIFLKETAARYPDLPRFLYGHSLGGNLALTYVLRFQPVLAGVIASAPLLRLARKPPGAKTALIRLLNTLHLNIPLSTGLEQAALSRDVNVVRLYQEDPWVHEHITPALADSMLREGEWCLLHAHEFPLPLLLMHGEADRITSVEASIEFADQIQQRCSLKIWDGLYHELHNEPEQADVLNCVLQWMKIQTGEKG